MRILVTGANGFLGAHLVRALSGMADINVLTYVRGDELSSLYAKLTELDFIFHLAGVNRPKNKDDFLSSNVQLTADICKFLCVNEIRSTVYFSSSIHSEGSTNYGASKLAAENLLKELALENGNRIIVQKLPRIFGPGAKPNYNSVVATFCYAVVKDLPVTIDSPDLVIGLSYVEDWVSEMVQLTFNPDYDPKFVEYQISLKNLYNFFLQCKLRGGSCLDDFKSTLNNSLIKKLFTTYCYYEFQGKSI